MKKLNHVVAASLAALSVWGLSGCASLGGGCACEATTNTCACGAACACTDCTCQGPVGRWALDREGAYWLGIEKAADGTLSAKLLWRGGSPNPQQDVKVEGLVATMKQTLKGDKNPAKARVRITTLTAAGTKANLTFQTVDGTGKILGTETATATRIPALPPAPDRAQAVFGAPVDLLSSLDGWKSMNPTAHFGWSMKDGVLSNRIKRKPDGSRDGHGANLVTKRADFFDFKISYDVRVLPNCNSGVYLRGIYEIQVLDSYGKPVDCHNMAAFYGRITPSVAAEKPANEWQHVDVMLYKRHVTVTLNGVTIIDNQPVLGCTGGAITSNEFVPGPIYLQGDHSDADFRNMVLTPIVK